MGEEFKPKLARWAEGSARLFERHWGAIRGCLERWGHSQISELEISFQLLCGEGGLEVTNPEARKPDRRGQRWAKVEGERPV